MTSGKLLVAGILVIASSMTCAESITPSSSDKNTDKTDGWISITPDMGDNEYRKAYKYNRKYTQDFALSYSKNVLMSIGIPKTGINYMGGIAALAVTHDISFHLGDSKLFAVEIKDVTEKNPSLFFGFKMDW